MAKIIIGVLTARGYVQRQQGVLTTWGSDALSDPEVDLVFLVGDPDLHSPKRDGNTLFLPCPDDYWSLPQKTRWFCKWALTVPGWRWLFKCDDDSYVRIERLMAGSWSNAVIGCADGVGLHWHGGAGYLVDPTAATAICNNMTAETGLEDQLARDAIQQAGLWFDHEPRFCFNCSQMPNPLNDGITCHYCSPVRLRLVHDQFYKTVSRGNQIPQKLHFVWLGNSVPQVVTDRIKQWSDLHPHWQVRLWRDVDIRDLRNQEIFDAARTPAQKAAIARYEILYREGGVYVDCDVECRKPIDELAENSSGFACAEDDDVVGVAVLGSAPGSPVLEDAIQRIPESFTNETDVPCQTGSRFFTKTFLRHTEHQLLWWDTFFPLHWSGQKFAPVENAYGVHLWDASWRR